MNSINRLIFKIHQLQTIVQLSIAVFVLLLTFFFLFFETKELESTQVTLLLEIWDPKRD